MHGSGITTPASDPAGFSAGRRQYGRIRRGGGIRIMDMKTYTPPLQAIIAAIAALTVGPASLLLATGMLPTPTPTPVPSGTLPAPVPSGTNPMPPVTPMPFPSPAPSQSPAPVAPM